MGDPKMVDGYFMSDSDLTDYDYNVKDSEPFYGVCPICGSESIVCSYDNYEDFDSTYIRTFHCCKCGSDFSFTYWVKGIYVIKDGRFNKED